MIEIKSWCPEIEESAQIQVNNLAAHPKAFHHIALMPDCHAGMGMPIGGVMAVDGAVIPNAVGVDIGCGVSATQLTAEGITEEQIKHIIGELRPLIPMGFKHHNDPQDWEGFDRAPDIISNNEIKRAKKQLGTLGGGNHFIEIQKGNDGKVWLMLHSGSRNFGYKIARHYGDIAETFCNEFGILDLVENGLCYLPLCTKEANDYIKAMNFALDFAKENRERMMGIFEDITNYTLQSSTSNKINIHHNYATIENHFGKNIWIHRKGATSARRGQVGIIPGSMGTKSYIVEGLGNENSFLSCSHGAGRLMSRTKFNKTHTPEECEKAMEGVVYGRWGKDRKGGIDLSEAPQAYKDIDTVMENQKDLVKISVELKPLGVMKG